MKLTMQIQSDPHHTLILCHDAEAQKDVHRAEGWGTTEGMADVIAVDEAISFLLSHRRHLMEGKDNTILSSLVALHGAVAREMATNSTWRDHYSSLFAAMKSAEWFINKLDKR